MTKNWKDLTKQEKIYQIISLVFAVAGLVFVVLDIVTEWKYAHLCWAISWAFYLLMECKAKWNMNRKLAIVDLVLAIAMIVLSIFTMIL